MNSSTEHSSAPVRRRSLMKTAAWAAPTAAVSLSAPAFAASPESRKGLQGWVTVGKECPVGTRTRTITIDGVGNYPDRGLWIMETTEGLDLEDSVVEGAKITFYFEFDNLTWSNNSTGGGWSNLTRDNTAPRKSGYFAYTSTYSGTWQFDDENDVLLATGKPGFSTTVQRLVCPTVRAYARRTVTVDGEVVTFERGPIAI